MDVEDASSGVRPGYVRRRNQLILLILSEFLSGRNVKAVLAHSGWTYICFQS
jgi:hypothetical protein